LGVQQEEDQGFFIPEMEMQATHAKANESNTGKNAYPILGEGVRKCSQTNIAGLAGDEDMWDNLSSGEVETHESQVEGWEQGAANMKQTRKKRVLQATRQSIRLRHHGGVSVEEMATKRKQKQNLELSGTIKKILLPFLMISQMSS
jgi:hypothetical protein